MNDMTLMINELPLSMLSTKDIITIHDIIISHYDRPKGCRQGIIEGILEKINFVNSNDVYHNAAILLEGITRMHPFVDGNKRTALASTKIYMDIHCREFKFPKDTKKFIYDLAGNTSQDIDGIIDDLIDWIKLNSN